MHQKGSWHGLRGASKKEATREEVVAQAKADRAARSDARQRHKSATVIQSHWRSYAARTAQQQKLLHQWQERCAASAAQPDTLLPAQELQSGAVRLMLMALMPFGSSRSTRTLERGEPLGLGVVSNSTHGAAAHHSSNSGIRDSRSRAVAVRGTIALVLRSISSRQDELNYTSLATAGDAQAWRIQAVRLCQLCCSITAANPAEANPVLDAAATRLLQLMTTPASWGKAERVNSSGNTHSSAGGAVASDECKQQRDCNTAGTPADVSAAVEAVPDILCGLLQQPSPLLQAARRFAISHQQQQQQQQQSGTPVTAAKGAALDAAAVTVAGLQRLLCMVLKLLGICQSTSKGAEPRPRQQQQHFLQQVVLVLLTTPGWTAAMPTAIKVQLVQQHMLQELLLPAAEQLASQGKLSGVEALHCLANIAQLVTGCSTADGHQQQQQQQPGAGGSQHLENLDMATAYCNTAVQLLTASTTPSTAVPVPGARSVKQHGTRAPVSAADVLCEGCWMLGTQGHLLQLLRVLTSSHQDGIIVWAAYCTHLLQDSRTATGRTDNSNCRQGSSNSGLSRSVLSVMSFAPGVLPALWRWLAVTAGFPLEAPLQASRGLDVAAAARGPQGLQEQVVVVMGLLCRSVAQLLLVLDDADMHQHQTPFSLGTSRAVASTLNSLVFHTAFPDTTHKQQQQQLCFQVLPATSSHGMALLHEYAPAVLRGYYDRDARQSFCQPNLWTEPYNNLMAALAAQQQQQQGNVVVTTAAVVQALLATTGLTGNDNAGGSSMPAAAAPRPSSPAGAAAAAAGPVVPGLRTGALLSLLRAAPQCVPFTVRLELFRQMLQQDKFRGRWQLSPAEGGPRPLKLTVRRDVLLGDAYKALGGAKQAIKGRLKVTFVNSQGVCEAGLDQGGLMKELLEQVVAAGTQPEYGLFAATEGTGLIYPHPAAEAIPGGLGLLEFVGMMVGKALYDGILLNLAFAPFFLRSLQGGRAGVDDLAALDSTLHANLLAVKACPPDQVEHLGLTFAAEQQLFGKTVQCELVPGGDSISITADNRLLYVHLMADYHLNTRLGRAAAAFAGGLSVVLPPSWLRMFSPGELNQLISGGKDGGLDVGDMARYAKYSNGYSESSHTIRLFWRVLEEFTPQQRSALLRFVTSTSRAPLGGFKHLQPPLTIHKVDCGGSPLAVIGVGKDVDRLPSASTCYNMLKLPNYKKRSTLKDKLLYAIQSNAGFELS